MIRISILIWTLIALAAGLLGLMIAYHDAAVHFLHDPEVFKSTFQFLLTAVIGGGVALVFKELDYVREKRKALRGMHAEIMEAYNEAKKIRRHLRARLGATLGANSSTHISGELYDEQIDLLISAQLTFEIYTKRAKDSVLFFAPNAKLSSPLTKAEQYLNHVIDEYVEERKTFSGSPPLGQLSNLPKLREFIGRAKKGTDFWDNFKVPVSEALQALGKAVLR